MPRSVNNNVMNWGGVKSHVGLSTYTTISISV
jgi:hypothetical protein